jgi:hypothetical protein
VNWKLKKYFQKKRKNGNEEERNRKKNRNVGKKCKLETQKERKK